MVRALNKIASKTKNLEDINLVLQYVSKLKVRDSYKANLCDFYSQYYKYCMLLFLS